MQNKPNQCDTWMMWIETSAKDCWPVKSFVDSVSYFTQKYGHRPIKALFPTGTELPTLKPWAGSIAMDVSPYVLPKHIHLALDPTKMKESA